MGVEGYSKEAIIYDERGSTMPLSIKILDLDVGFG